MSLEGATGKSWVTLTCCPSVTLLLNGMRTLPRGSNSNWRTNYKSLLDRERMRTSKMGWTVKRQRVISAFQVRSMALFAGQMAWMMHILNLAESVAPRFVKDYRRVVFLGVCLGALDLPHPGTTEFCGAWPSWPSAILVSWRMLDESLKKSLIILIGPGPWAALRPCQTHTWPALCLFLVLKLKPVWRNRQHAGHGSICICLHIWHCILKLALKGSS